jgi:hypothetical protein
MRSHSLILILVMGHVIDYSEQHRHRLTQNLAALFVVFNLVDAQSMGAEEVVFTAQVLFKPFLLHRGERRWHSSRAPSPGPSFAAGSGKDQNDYIYKWPSYKLFRERLLPSWPRKLPAASLKPFQWSCADRSYSTGGCVPETCPQSKTSAHLHFKHHNRRDGFPNTGR